jgi:uncharacterized protein YggE
MEKEKMFKMGGFALGVLSVFLVVQIFIGLKQYGLLDQKFETMRTISVSADGEVFAVPDIASLHITVSEKGENPLMAQQKVSAIIDPVLNGLKLLRVDESDIQTTSYASYPYYENKPCIDYRCPPMSQGDIAGYETSQSLRIKIRDLDVLPDVLTLLSTQNVSQISGPDFTVDDQDVLLAQAREKAIDSAKKEAKDLARQLGVRLGKLTAFSEGGYYAPMARTMAMEMDSVYKMESAPSLPAGEQKISTSVTLTYQIK